MGFGNDLAYAGASLDDLMQQRYMERLAAEKQAESVRQFNVRTGENTREHLANEQARRDALAGTAQSRQDTLAQQAQLRQDAQTQRFAEGPTPPMDLTGSPMVGRLNAGGYGGYVTTTPAQQAAEGAGVLQTAPGAPTPQLAQPERQQFTGGAIYTGARAAAQEKATAAAQAAQDRATAADQQRTFQEGQSQLYKLTADQQLALKREAENQNAAPVLSGPSLDMTAKMYAKTGQLPPMGMGKAGAQVRSTIINRASQYNPANDSFEGATAAPDIAGNKSTYAAGQASEKQLTGNLNAVSAFAATADKNSALLIDAAKNIPNVGVAVLNRPLRAIATATGSPEMARYNALVKSVANEYGRLISQATLAGVLSDTARKEAESLLRSDYTPGQLIAALQTLKTEGENRKQAYTEQLKAVRSGMGGVAPTVTGGKKSAADWLKENGL